MLKTTSHTKSSLNSLITKLLFYPISFVTSILIARFLVEPEARGAFSFLLLIASFSVPILSFGSGIGITYNLSKSKFTVEESAFTLLINGLLHGLLAMIIVFVLWKMQWLGDSGKDIPFNNILILLIILPFGALSFYFNRLLVGKSYFVFTNRFSIVQAIIYIIGISVLIGYFNLGIMGGLLSVLAYNMAISGTFMFFSLRKYPMQWKWNRHFFKEIYSYGIKGWLGDLALRLNLRVDQMILGIYSAYALGIYGVSVLLAEVLWIIPDSLGPILMNKIAQEESTEKRNELIYKLHRVTFYGSLGLSLLGAVAGYFLIPILFGEKYEKAILPFLLVLPGIVVFSSTKIMTKLFSGTGKVIYTTSIILIGTSVSVSSYFILIPMYGATGAAIGSSIGYSTASIAALSLAVRKYDLHFKELFLIHFSDAKWLIQKVKKR
jgi:O-antigen/teichoic acid export membrane protein